MTIATDVTAADAPERIAGDGLDHQRRLDEGVLQVSAVVVGGRASESALSEGLVREGFRGRTFTIGDAVRPRDLYRAGREALEAGAIRPRRNAPAG